MMGWSDAQAHMNGDCWPPSCAACEAEEAAAPECDDCGRPVLDEDMGPSCAGHVLHDGCETPCRDCLDERSEQTLIDRGDADREYDRLTR